jgi:hypothetical protein
MKLSANKVGKAIGGLGAALAGAVALLLGSPASAAAQCIMCYMSATGAGERGSHVLRMGIIVLAVPTLLTFAGIALLAYRRRKPAEWPTEPGEEGFPLANRAAAGLLPLPADQQGRLPSAF